MFAAVYLLYEAVRGMFAGRLGVARAHAELIVGLERALHLGVETAVQHALGEGVAGWLLSNVYLIAQTVAPAAALFWLYRHSPVIYRRLRRTVIGAWLLALPVFVLFPVAPPRLTGTGVVDTVSQQAAVSLTGHSTLFYNPYAAVPSLHVAVAFAIAIAMAIALQRPWTKLLAAMWCPLVITSVIATGNHYLFDVAAGLLVTGLAYALMHLAGHMPRAVVPIRRPHRLVAVPARS
jgi:membrane-associated phospholipid phosphatase